jgi:micrococcal nuclease
MRRRGRIRSRWIGWLGGISAAVLLAGPLVDGFNALRHPVQAGDETCRIIQVLDGDTIRLWCPSGGTEAIRLTGFDTPELFSPQCLSEHWAAQKATWAMRWMIHESGALELAFAKRRDRYERRLGALTLDGVALSDRLIGAGLARPYDGGRRQGWCD